jgi:hypothetical protein
MEIVDRALGPLVTVVGGWRYTADKQYNTNPPLWVLDAFSLVASSF